MPSLKVEISSNDFFNEWILLFQLFYFILILIKKNKYNAYVIQRYKRSFPHRVFNSLSFPLEFIYTILNIIQTTTPPYVFLIKLTLTFNLSIKINFNSKL